MAMSLEQLEKGGQISKLRSNTYHIVKNHENWSSRSRDNCLQGIIKKQYKNRELTQACRVG